MRKTSQRQKSSKAKQYLFQHRLLVGTASWTDPGFIKDWYPCGLAATESLSWYSEHFNLVEVNSSFYSVPDPKSTQRWSQQTPSYFTFDVKLHKLLSRHSTAPELLPAALRPHARVEKARVVLTPALEEAMTKHLLKAVEPLQEDGKLGVLLLQLSPSFSPQRHELAELDHLLGLLQNHQVAVELRNRHWVEGTQAEATAHYFKTRAVALVIVDAPASEHFMVMPPSEVLTDPSLVYMRCHGRNETGYIRGRTVAERFNYDYSEKELAGIASSVAKLMGRHRAAHIVFNNNFSDYAPKAASQFQDIFIRKHSQLLLKSSA